MLPRRLITAAAGGAGQRVRKQGLEQAELVLGGKRAQLLQRGVADAPLGCRGRAQKGRIVVVVDQQPR